MTNHKFTDEEVIKALQICSTEENHCGQCPSADNGLATCIQIMCENALALINRQKAEIEELEKIKQNSLEIISMGEKQILEVGAKYIKEFAEKVKPMFEKIVEIMFDGNEPTCQVENCHKPDSIACNSRICVDENKEYWNTQVDNLVKEMTEGVE
ncbi:MAG: hypothetical protein IJW55_07470 [Clostridia bacterium]|nr:hypothetical protein [Clostridia bacterium]